MRFVPFDSEGFLFWRQTLLIKNFDESSLLKTLHLNRGIFMSDIPDFQFLPSQTAWRDNQTRNGSSDKAIMTFNLNIS